ncbi:hypothetical protein GCM10027610_041220 [Dactylosporangium cerinum]
MPGDIRKRYGERVLEVAVNELVVAAAHARRGDFHQDPVRADLGHRNLFDPKRLLVPVHPSGSHLHDLLSPAEIADDYTAIGVSGSMS